MGICFGKQQQKQQGMKRRPSAVVSGGLKDAAFLPSEEGEGEPRVISCEESIQTTLGQLNIRYGYISQRGYYPDGTFLCLSLRVWRHGAY